jgi:hypothetical protein
MATRAVPHTFTPDYRERLKTQGAVSGGPLFSVRGIKGSYALTTIVLVCFIPFTGIKANGIVELIICIFW